MAGDEVAQTPEVEHHEGEVTSPDQHRRMVSPRLARLGAVLTVIVLTLMAFFGNHKGGVEKVFLVGIAGVILLILILDPVLRKAGLKS